MDVKYFALQQWVDGNLIVLKYIGTGDNKSDGMTNPLLQTLFYRHMDFILGKLPPTYVTAPKSTVRTILHTPETGVQSMGG